MQHHFDEFSVTDIRHTMNEVWRVVRERRWLFILPFCALSTVACFCSLLIPRAYSVSTIIKREQDPVFASLMGPNWTQPYEEIRQSMPRDIRQDELIGDVIDALGLPKDLTRLDDGTLTPESEQRRAALIREVTSGLKVQLLDLTKNRELAEIGLTISDPVHAGFILQHIRDKYIEKTRRRTIELLAGVDEFLKSEAARLSDRLRDAQQSLVELELKYPGVNPETVDPREAQQTALLIERVQLERKSEELQSERHQTQLESDARSSSSTSIASGAMVEQQNARHGELWQEVQRIERTITESKAIKMMTEEHPEIRRARALLAARREELARTPATIQIPFNHAANGHAGLSLAEQLSRQALDIESRQAALQRRREQVSAKLQEIEQFRTSAMQHRQEYLKKKAETNHLSDELASMAKAVAPIKQVLHLEDKNRSIHFITVRDVNPVKKPSFPDSKLMILICFGVSAAIAVLAVLLAELVDRSFRTIKQLSSSLGIPVIECIDQIRTKAMQRRQMVRSFVMLPAIMIVLLTAMVFAGTKAYVDLENPKLLQPDEPRPSSTLRASLDMD